MCDCWPAVMAHPVAGWCCCCCCFACCGYCGCCYWCYCSCFCFWGDVAASVATSIYIYIYMGVSQIGSSQRKPELLTPNEKPHRPKRDHTETTETYLGAAAPRPPAVLLGGCSAPDPLRFCWGASPPDPSPGGCRPLDPRLI